MSCAVDDLMEAQWFDLLWLRFHVSAFLTLVALLALILNREETIEVILLIEIQLFFFLLFSSRLVLIKSSVPLYTLYRGFLDHPRSFDPFPP